MGRCTANGKNFGGCESETEGRWRRNQETESEEAADERVRVTRRLRDAERQMWQEKLDAEVWVTEKKTEIERTTKASLAKLPQL